MPIELHALPVREGDATLILDRSDAGIDTAILIDTGRKKGEAAAYLDRLGIVRLDLLLLSHIDLDHIGGMECILDRFQVGQVWCFDIYRLKDALDASPPELGKGDDPRKKREIYPTIMRLISADKGLRKGLVKGVPCWSVEEGHSETLGRIAIEVLWPPSSFVNHVLTPGNLRKFFSEKRPPSSWILEDFEKGLNAQNEEPNIDRREAQRRAKKRLADRVINDEMANEGADNDGLYEVDDTGYWPGEHFANNLSIVARVKLLGDISGTTLLFPGDLEDWTGIITRQSPRLRSSIWKVPHHGSRGVGFDFSPFIDEKIMLDLYRHTPFGPFWYEWCHEWHRWAKKHRRLPPMPFPIPWALPMLPVASQLSAEEDWLQGGADKIARFVDPAKTLVFPFPSRNLPNLENLETGVVWGEVVANRAPSPVLSLELNNCSREPSEAVIVVAK